MNANALFSPNFPRKWPTPAFHYSTCATLRGHLSNCWTHTKITERNSTKLCHVFGSRLSHVGKCTLKIWEVPSIP